jgi:hypothetical protein
VLRLRQHLECYKNLQQATVEVMLKSSNHSDIKDSQEEPAKKSSKKRVIAPAKTGLDSPLLFVQPEDGVFKPLRNEAGLLNNINYPL